MMQRPPSVGDQTYAAAFAAYAGRLRPIGPALAVHNGIPVQRAGNSLVGVQGGRNVFFVESRPTTIKIHGRDRVVNRVRRAWRDFSVPGTEGFLLTLYVPLILQPYGLALSAGKYSPRAQRLQQRVLQVVPHAYAWMDGRLDALSEQNRDGLIVFSMEALPRG